MRAYTSTELRQYRRRTPVDIGLIVFACLWPKAGQNLGTLARTADALNASLVLPRDVLAKRALRTGNTIGTHNSNVEWIDDPGLWLADQVGRIVGVELSPESIPLIGLRPATDRTVVVLGHESTGVPSWALDLCSEVVELPMHGVGNSLNVAVAGSIVGYKLAGLC